MEFGGKSVPVVTPPSVLAQCDGDVNEYIREVVRIGAGQCKKRNVHGGNGAVAQRSDYTPVKCGKRRMHIQRTW